MTAEVLRSSGSNKYTS